MEERGRWRVPCISRAPALVARGQARSMSGHPILLGRGSPLVLASGASLQHHAGGVHRDMPPVAALPEGSCRLVRPQLIRMAAQEAEVLPHSACRVQEGVDARLAYKNQRLAR